MKYSFFVVIIFLFVYCGSKNEEPKKLTDNRYSDSLNFCAYYQQIPILDLPFIVNCDGYHCANDTSMFPKIVNKYYSNYISVVGRIFPNSNFVSIVYHIPSDYGFPFVITYDNCGNRIDSLGLKIEDCYIDPAVEGRILTKINSTKEILMIDTLINSDWDKDFKTVLNVDTVVSQHYFAVSLKGKFEVSNKIHITAAQHRPLHLCGGILIFGFVLFCRLLVQRSLVN